MSKSRCHKYVTSAKISSPVLRNLVQMTKGNGPGSTVRMATEVVDMIIDYLHDCKPALESCALVSHAWLPASRFHLFRSIELRPNSRALHYPQHCNKLYALIQRSPNIITIIRELHIHDGRWHHVWVNGAPLLVLVLNSLTHLNTLHLKGIHWVKLTQKLRAALRRVFVSNPVSNFDFEQCRFPFSSLLSFLNTCSTLISLTLLSVSLSNSPEAVENEEAGYVKSKSKCRFHELRIVR
jgi:hypothetical protein